MKNKKMQYYIIFHCAALLALACSVFFRLRILYSLSSCLAPSAEFPSTSDISFSLVSRRVHLQCSVSFERVRALRRHMGSFCRGYVQAEGVIPYFWCYMPRRVSVGLMYAFLLVSHVLSRTFVRLVIRDQHPLLSRRLC